MLNNFLKIPVPTATQAHDFAARVFRECQLDPPGESQTKTVCAVLDGGRNAPFDVLDCLCLVDALLRMVLHFNDAPAPRHPAERHPSPTRHPADAAAVRPPSPSPSPPSCFGAFGRKSDAGVAAMPAAARGPSARGLPPDVKRWSPQDAARWVVEVAGLPAEVGEMFVAEEICGAVLLNLDGADLESLGVAPFGRRRQLLLGIAALCEQQAPRPAAARVAATPRLGDANSLLLLF